MKAIETVTDSPSHLIIGVAGHFGHGKTELVKALTGIDADSRFSTIFLPSGLEADVIDMPGQEPAIGNIPAGLSSIDVLLLAVAADNGVTPQTIEYLAIAGLFGVPRAVIVITKADIMDGLRLTKVESRIKKLLDQGAYKEAPIVKVSTKTRVGLVELIEAIERQAAALSRRQTDLPPRLFIERSFVSGGAGRIVTGILSSGVLTTVGPLELLPQGQICHLRRIDVGGKSVSKALAGQMLAVNMIVNSPKPRRGDVLVPPATFSLAHEIFASVTVLSQAPEAVKCRTRLHLYHGTKKVSCVLSPIGSESIEPGSCGYAHLALSEPIVAVFRDRFVLRSEMAATTIGGGIVLEACVKSSVGFVDCAHLEALASGDDRQAIKESLRGRRQPLTGEELADATQISAQTAKIAIADLIKNNAIAVLDIGRCTYYMDMEVIQSMAGDLDALLLDFHAAQPDSYGAEKKEIQSRLWPGLSSSQAEILFNHFILSGRIIQKDGRIALAQRAMDASVPKLARIRRNFRGFLSLDIGALVRDMKISVAEIRALLDRLESEESIIRVGPEQYFAHECVEEATGRLLEFLAEAGEITARQLKEILNTTEKDAIAFLEYFVEQKVIRRAGEVWVPCNKFADMES